MNTEAQGWEDESAGIADLPPTIYVDYGAAGLGSAQYASDLSDHLGESYPQSEIVVRCHRIRPDVHRLDPDGACQRFSENRRIMDVATTGLSR